MKAAERIFVRFVVAHIDHAHRLRPPWPILRPQHVQHRVALVPPDRRSCLDCTQRIPRLEPGLANRRTDPLDEDVVLFGLDFPKMEGERRAFGLDPRPIGIDSFERGDQVDSTLFGASLRGPGYRERRALGELPSDLFDGRADQLGYAVVTFMGRCFLNLGRIAERSRCSSILLGRSHDSSP